MVMSTFRAFRIAINSDISAETNVGLSRHLWRMRAPVIVNPEVILFWISISFIIIIQITLNRGLQSPVYTILHRRYLSIKMYDTNLNSEQILLWSCGRRARAYAHLAQHSVFERKIKCYFIYKMLYCLFPLFIGDNYTPKYIFWYKWPALNFLRVRFNAHSVFHTILLVNICLISWFLSFKSNHIRDKRCSFIFFRIYQPIT